jgi:hypothetical protein
MNNELVELVVQLYEKNWGVKDYGLARAVVAMCMEEAAKVAEYRCGAAEWSADTNSGYECAAREIAAAIRALKEK